MYVIYGENGLVVDTAATYEEYVEKMLKAAEQK